MKRLLLLIGTTAWILCAADVSGKWTGTSEFVNKDGQRRTGPILLTLAQRGEEVTGTAGPTSERQAPIQSGKVSGDTLTFEVPDPNGKAVAELTVSENLMKGEVKFHREYGVITMTLSLKRE